jgi:CheY-like chemotaxis protein
MAHLVYLLAAASPSLAKSVGSGLNLLQIVLAVLTVILLILFVGFLFSGRRRESEDDAAESAKALAALTPDDGDSSQERVIYHAQPRPLTFSPAVAEAPAETTPEPAATEPAAAEPHVALQPEPAAEQPSPAQAPTHVAPGRPLTAWARSPAAASGSPTEGQQPTPSPGSPPVKAPPFIFPSTQRAGAQPAEAPASEGAGPEPSAASIAAPVAAAALVSPAAALPTVVARAREAEPAPTARAAAGGNASPALAEAARIAEGEEGALILLIEDDERIAKFYTILFQAKGYRVENAHDGIEGVDMAQSLNPALILLDVMMPRMNGLMVLQVLRANPETAKTPVVVLSNYMEPPLIQRALQLGAIEYVVKSQARPEQLVNALPSWLKGEPAIH